MAATTPTDAYGNPLAQEGLATRYTRVYDPLLASQRDIELQRNQALATLGTQLGIGAIPTVVQGIGMAMPTAQDTWNEQELAKLERLAREGRLGLSGEERQHAEATIMNPVRQLATERLQRDEARLASMGDTGSVAAQQRIQRAGQQAISGAAAQAGIEIERAHMARAAEQRQEAEERRAYKSARQKQPWEMVGKALADLAPALGTVAAGFAQARAPTDRELLAFAQETTADGDLLRPDIAGKDADALRALWKQGAFVERGNPYADTLKSGAVGKAD